MSASEVPEHSDFWYRLFVVYLRGYFRKSFHAVRTSRAGTPPPAAGPLIVYSNHPSWWDPIHFSLLASAKLPERRLYGPMDAEALDKYRFFKKLGVFGIDRSPRGVAAFLRTSLAVLDQPRTSAPRSSAGGGAARPNPSSLAARPEKPMPAAGHLGRAPSLWLTAEGEFTDPRRRPVRILPGVAHLARRLESGTVVPLALEYPFWNERDPEALSRFGAAIDLAAEPERTTREWTRMLEQRLEDTMDALAADAESRDPGRFETVLAGRAGIGGVYDGWRRLRAWLSGRSFSAAHGDVASADAAREDALP